MAIHSVTTSTEQEATLAWLVKTNNTEQGTTFTVDQFIQAQLNALLAPFILRYHQAEADAVRAGFDAQTDGPTRAQIKTAAGVGF